MNYIVGIFVLKREMKTYQNSSYLNKLLKQTFLDCVLLSFFIIIRNFTFETFYKSLIDFKILSTIHGSRHFDSISMPSIT